MIRIQQIHLTLEEDMTLLPEKIIKKIAHSTRGITILAHS